MGYGPFYGCCTTGQMLCIIILLFIGSNCDIVAEWLRRWIANPLLFERASSNLAVVAFVLLLLQLLIHFYSSDQSCPLIILFKSSTHFACTFTYQLLFELHIIQLEVRYENCKGRNISTQSSSLTLFCCCCETSANWEGALRMPLSVIAKSAVPGGL